MRYFLGMMLLVISTHYSFAYPVHSGQWTHRSVIYFAPSNDEHVKQFLLESIINDCNLEERDIVTLVITEDGYTASNESNVLTSSFGGAGKIVPIVTANAQHQVILEGTFRASTTTFFHIEWGSFTSPHEVIMLEGSNIELTYLPLNL